MRTVGPAVVRIFTAAALGVRTRVAHPPVGAARRVFVVSTVSESAPPQCRLHEAVPCSSPAGSTRSYPGASKVVIGGHPVPLDTPALLHFTALFD